MVLGSEAEATLTRFTPYVQELQDFFAGRGMEFGSPRDLDRLTERLAGPSFFHDELSSMVRAIIYREAETIDSDQLVEIVASATAGPSLAFSTAHTQQNLRRLTAFVLEAQRSLWRRLPDAPGASYASPENDLGDNAEYDPAHDSLDPPPAAPIPARDGTATTVAASTASASHSTPVLESRSDRFSRARELLAQQLAQQQREAEAAEQLHAAAAALELHDSLPPVPPFEPEHVPPAEPPLWRLALRSRFLWIAVACGVSAGLAAGVLVSSRNPAPGTALHGAARPATRPFSPLVPKPTPYVVQNDTSVPLPAAEPLLPSQAPAPRPAAALVTPSPRRFGSGFPIASRPAVPAPGTVRLTAPATPASQAFGRPAAPANRPALASGFAVPAPPRRPLPPAPVPLSPQPVPRGTAFITSSGIMTSNLLFAPAPLYPGEAIEAGLQGRVVLEALVWRDGTVSATRLLRGDQRLGAAAQQAVRHWRYRPYVADGQPQDMPTTIVLDFRLQH
jgi:TonB family protein